jgi:hypothetical protein
MSEVYLAPMLLCPSHSKPCNEISLARVCSLSLSLSLSLARVHTRAFCHGWMFYLITQPFVFTYLPHSSIDIFVAVILFWFVCYALSPILLLDWQNLL